MSAFNTPKTTALAPMASVSVKTAVMVKPGDLRSWRSANRTSAQIDSSVGHCHTSRLRSSKQRPVAESSPRCPRRFFGTHPFAHQLLGTLFNVQANLFGEIFVELTAAENLRNPVHWRFLSAGPSTRCGFTWVQDQ